jgi:O-antigen ligase
MRIEAPSLWLVPAYLVMCIALGGSAQGIWVNMLLQLVGLGLIAWTLATRPVDAPTRASRQLAVLAATAVAVIMLQLVPLPASLWTALPGRDLAADGLRTLGYPFPSLPVSLAPYETVTALLTAVPAIAMLSLVIRMRQREGFIAAALLLAVVAAVLLGALQVAGGGPLKSPWYFYPISNFGAVGFFANVNHMGSLLLVSIPFAMALFAGLLARKQERSLSQGVHLVGVAALIVTAFGIALNRSLAALIIAVPVLLFSTLLLRTGSNFRRLAIFVATVAVIGSLLVLTTTSISGSIAEETFTVPELRGAMWAATADLIRQSFPVGTGLGTFDAVFHSIEDPAQVTATYVNHAHNDYLQLVLELGLAGALLIAAFLAWWLAQVVRIWRSPASTLYVRAATIASGALLAHSIVDYPLRTAALSAVFAICIGLMAQPRQQQNSSDKRQARPARHVTIR